MKFKIFLLFLVSTIIIFFTYNHTYKKTIHILSINNLSGNENYNNYVSNLLSNTNMNYMFNVDFSGRNLQVDNLIAEIENNKNSIQSYIHDSEVIILSVDSINNKQISNKVMIDKLSQLFTIIRKYNSKEIIYVSPYNLKNTIMVKKMCNKYNVIFINGASFNRNPLSIAKIITKKIDDNWNKEKY